MTSHGIAADMIIELDIDQPPDQSCMYLFELMMTHGLTDAFAFGTGLPQAVANDFVGQYCR